MARKRYSFKELQERIKDGTATEGSGFTHYAGVRVGEVRPGFCRAYIDIGDEHLNPSGYMHGGAIFTLMDVAAGYSAVYAETDPRPVVTQCGEVHFLRPLKEGKVSAEGTILKSGKTTAYSRVDVYSADGTLCATGSFDIFYTDGRK